MFLTCVQNLCYHIEEPMKMYFTESLDQEPHPDTLMQQVYEKWADGDGFLYIAYG